MNDRERIKSWGQTNPNLIAESKQADLDKANARIAQLENILNEINTNPDWAKHGMPNIEPASTWLLEHDKAVKTKVLEAVVDVESKFGWRGVLDMIESRKSKQIDNHG